MPWEFFETGAQLVDEPSDDLEFFWREQIPAGGITLFYGPTSSGKSQFQWQLLQAVQEGSTLFGEEVPQGNTMLFQLDMPKRALKIRWRSMDYRPTFPVFLSTSVNVLDPGFSKSLEFKGWREAYNRVKPKLIGVDAVGHIHDQDASTNQIVNKVYDFFHREFSEATKHFLHHDRKVTTEGYFGKERQDDDALGSANWRNFAVSSSHIYPLDDFRRKLVHTKSQVAELDDPLIFIQHRTGDLELWTREVWKRFRDELMMVSSKVGIPIRDQRSIPKLTEEIMKKGFSPYAQYKKLERHLRRLYLGWKALEEEL